MDLRPVPGANYERNLTAGTICQWSWATPDDADTVEIDLYKVKWIDSMGLATIAAVVEDAHVTGRSVNFVPPRMRDVCTYMSRMHLGQCLEEFGVVGHLPTVNEWDTGNRLAELQRFDCWTSDDLAERVFAAHMEAGGLAEEAVSFFKGVSEVVSNVVDHSGAAGGWAVMQVMPNADGLITFAVADAGYGLEETLQRHHTVTGPVDAMAKAFQREISGTGQHGRGTGLDDLRLRVGRHRGHLRAWSGGAVGLSSGGPLACREVSAAFPGTVIYAGFQPEPRM